MQFDCKTARVRMRGGKTLRPEAAASALRKVDLGMGEFAGGPPPSLAVLRAVLRPADGTTAAPTPELARALAREVASVAESTVEADGRLTLLLRPDAQADREALGAVLGRRGWAATALEDLSWPATATPYLVTLRSVSDAPDRTRTRGALERAEGVLAAIQEPGRADFVVWLREPCANVTDRMERALGGTASLAAVTPRPAGR